MIDENVAPRPVDGVDFDSLSPSPTPEQFYLLSRIDGKTTVGQLCKISGLSRDDTLGALQILARAGAIEVPGLDVASDGGEAADEVSSDDSKPEAVAAPDKGAKTGDESQEGDEVDKSDAQADDAGVEPGVRPNYPVPPEDYECDPALLEAEVPLELARRREVICLYEQLSEMTFYDLFGLDADASGKAIKKAYFRMSKRYHPDKFFRKDVGEFGPMVEQIFKEITKAYRTLSNSTKRETYDRELQAQDASPQQAESSVEASDEAASEDVEGEKSARNKRKAASVLLMRRAEKLEKRGEYEQAAVEYRKALALSRDGQAALRVAGVFIEQAKMGQEAASFARAALELDADEASARFLLGRAHELLDSPEAAIEEYRRVLDKQPSHQQARERLEQLDD